MSQPRARAKAKTAKAPYEAIRPEFNQAEHVVDSLSRQNTELTKKVAILEAAVAERDAFIQANAEALGLSPVQSVPAEHTHENEEPV